MRTMALAKFDLRADPLRLKMTRDQSELQAWLNDAALRQRECSSLTAPIPAGVDPQVVLGERVQAIVAALNYAARDVDRDLTIRCDRTVGLPRAVTIRHSVGADVIKLTWSPDSVRVGGVRRYLLAVDPARFDYAAPDIAIAFLRHLSGVLARIAEPDPPPPSSRSVTMALGIAGGFFVSASAALTSSDQSLLQLERGRHQIVERVRGAVVVDPGRDAGHLDVGQDVFDARLGAGRQEAQHPVQQRGLLQLIEVGRRRPPTTTRRVAHPSALDQPLLRHRGR